MELTFVYRGKLKANGSVEHKHEIRRIFHQQLREFWKRATFDPSEKLARQIGKFRFFPLVVEEREEVAELQITMLRPESPGNLINQGGDIDNRLKTLFDSFRMPRKDDEIPSADSPGEGEDPFFCLLEDDKLVTKVSISTDQLLEPHEKEYVHLLIHIIIKQRPVIGANMVITVG